MTRRINERLRAAAEEFARRAVAEPGDKLNAIVLYGSVARGEAHRESDIDLLLICPDVTAIRPCLRELRTDLMLEHEHPIVLSLYALTPAEVSLRLEGGSAFIQEVFRDGIALYDSGIFAGLRHEAVTAGR